MTLEGLFQKQLNTLNNPAKKISKIEKVLLLKQILTTTNTLFNNTSIYPMIEELLSVFDEFSLTMMDSIDTSTYDLLTKQKIETSYYLYKQFIQLLPKHNYLTLVDPLLESTIVDNTQYVFMTEKILYPKMITYLNQLDVNHQVTILLNNTSDSTICTTYFNNSDIQELTRDTPYLDSLYAIINKNTNLPFTGTSRFTSKVEATPLHEIQTVVLDIYQQIVDNNALYHDFAIYYPDNQYRDILEKVLTSFSIPFNMSKKENYSVELKACYYFLQYTFTNKEEDLLSLLDTLCVKACTSFVQVNYYKKQWQELHTIDQDSYVTYKQHLIDSYSSPLNKSSTYHEYAVVLKTFIQEELVFSEACTTLINYLTNIEACNDSTSLKDFMNFIECTKPNFTNNQKPLIDHIYVFHHQQVYSALLQVKKVYIVGVNETIVPPLFKDEGILLDNERQKLNGLDTIYDRVMIARNNILKILTSHTHITFSYAMASGSGETLLPSSLFLQLKDNFDIPSLKAIAPYAHSSLVHNLYLLGGKDITLPINTVIDQFKQTKNQPQSLLSPLFNEQLSASQLETYNGCPYKYFHQYFLGIQPFTSYLLQPNEIGTLVHHLLEINSSLFSSQASAKEANLSTLQTTIVSQIQEYIEGSEVVKAKSNHPINQYFINCLSKDMYTTICVLINQMKVSSFSLTSTEEKITSVYPGFKMKGFVDRIDTFRNYLKVIDYKSSDKELDLNLAMQGFNMQMLIYMDMLSKNKQLDKGALLYFNTKKRILKNKDSILDTIDEKDFFSLYKMNGYVHEDVIEEIDNQIDGRSNIIKVRFVKSKDSYNGNILNTNNFNTLIDRIEEHIQELYKEMVKGNISITPKGSYDMATHTKVNPCTYCSYRSLCHFDAFYNEYILVDNLDVDTILGGGNNE